MRTLFIFLLLANNLFPQGHFYRQYWADFDENISNHKDGRWRVNDPQLALHETFGKRPEALANGLVLLNVPESLFDLESAELYLEMWGGHPHTTQKRVTVNGKGVYSIPDFGTSEGHCVYTYPTVTIEPSHLVNGINALQFSCERGDGFWGHFIMDNVAVRCYFNTDSLIKRHPDLTGFHAAVHAPEVIKNEHLQLSLDIAEEFEAVIESVEFFAHYSGFDDNGNGHDADWHGYTFKRQWRHHVGSAETAPFKVRWNTDMIPDQSKPLQFKALVKLTNGFYYETKATTGSLLQRKKESVILNYCYDAPVPFWSRAGNVKIGKINLSVEPKNIVKAELQIKIWDGGEGEVENPFTINGHAYPITSKRAIHDVVHTIIDVDPAHLSYGDNEMKLVSDTHHHGIEILRPGPCLVIRTK